MAFVQPSQVAWNVFSKHKALCSLPVRSVASLAMTGRSKTKNLETAQNLHRELSSPSSWCVHSMRFNTAFGAYEPWSEDMACILQGSCMPGSTRYCRTSSMFGKVNLFDVAQGSTVSQRASFHTYRPYIAKPMLDMSRSFSLTGSNESGLKNVGLWSEDIACILQGTCLPGSTKYCRTASMFGTLGLSDVVQGTSSRSYSTSGSAPEQDGGQWA